jgi:hypothetical protein
MSWGLPIALSLLTIPLLMFGFGFSQQQTPTPAASTAATPTPTPEQANSLELAAPTPEPTPTPSPQATATPALSDPATLTIARIHSPSMAANFRAAPSLQSSVLGVLMHGDLVERLIDRPVQQDGIIWVPVRWRGQSGWLAQNFLGGQTNAAV